jgi:uncharacterized protein
MIQRLLLLLALLIAAPALAQDFPALSGRVVDQANLLSDEQEYDLTQRLAALEAASSRQLVVATVTSLQDHEIEDYGYKLGRHWGIGQNEASNGVILLVAPNERKVRIEVGYGLEGILTDALTGQIIRDRILPRFRENDYPGGIMAGAQEIITQLQAPPEVAEQRALAAQQSQASDGEGSIPTGILLAFAGILVFMFLAPWAISTLERSHDRAYRKSGRRRRRRDGSVWIWGPGWGSGWSDGGSSWGSGGSWGGGGGGSFGGFSGGGGSFGGGGASGSW